MYRNGLSKRDSGLIPGDLRFNEELEWFILSVNLIADAPRHPLPKLRS